TWFNEKGCTRCTRTQNNSRHPNVRVRTNGQNVPPVTHRVVTVLEHLGIARNQFLQTRDHSLTHLRSLAASMGKVGRCSISQTTIWIDCEVQRVLQSIERGIT